MTPQQCVEARVRLGWSRQDLAEAAGLAAPIVRMFEAGALAGFDDCEAAIAEALIAAEAAAPERLAICRADSRRTARARLRARSSGSSKCAGCGEFSPAGRCAAN